MPRKKMEISREQKIAKASKILQAMLIALLKTNHMKDVQGYQLSNKPLAGEERLLAEITFIVGRQSRFEFEFFLSGEIDGVVIIKRFSRSWQYDFMKTSAREIVRELETHTFF